MRSQLPQERSGWGRPSRRRSRRGSVWAPGLPRLVVLHLQGIAILRGGNGMHAVLSAICRSQPESHGHEPNTILDLQFAYDAKAESFVRLYRVW
jgi:hypothetical protein